MLEARGLACSRGSVALFRDLSFEIGAGRWLALRGPNGAGKTTLIRCVAGLTRPDAGDVSWNGASTHAERERFNTQALYSGHLAGIKDDLTAEENLAALLRLRGVEPAAESSIDALAEVGLAKRSHLPARRLSAGQRRRIGLARLMLDPAQLWLLDEPLAALDDDGEALFARLLERHLQRGGLALIATHQEIGIAGGDVLRMGS